MAQRAKAQRLIQRINDARNDAGLDPTSTTPESLTLQQVEAEAASLRVTPESLLCESRGRAA